MNFCTSDIYKIGNKTPKMYTNASHHQYIKVSFYSGLLPKTELHPKSPYL